jgi:hypothetical protein
MPDVPRNVRKEVMQAVPHFRRKARHDAVDHNHGGHTKHHADDTGKSNVLCSQITNAEQQLVHSCTPLRRKSVPSSGQMAAEHPLRQLCLSSCFINPAE